MTFLIAATALISQGSGFAETFPHPTGNNGWEEYVKAADAVRAIRYLGGSHVRDRKGLAHSREISARANHVLRLIQVGNKKPLTYPWRIDIFEIDERHPSTGLSDVGIFLGHGVRIAFADGMPDQAVQIMKDMLTYADRTSDGDIIDALIAQSTLASVFVELRDGAQKLGRKGAHDLALVFDSLVARPQPLQRASERDFRVKMAGIDRWLQMTLEAKDQGAPEEVLKLTAEDKAIYAGRIKAALRSYYQSQIERYQLDERFWANPLPLHSDPIIQYAVDSLMNPPVPQLVAQIRTQFRLAALHCRVIEFKRNFNRWPKSLSEIGGREVWYDPASGGPFFYAVLSDQSYSLYSLGTPETGRIDLVYKRENMPSPNNRYVPRNPWALRLERNRRN